MPILIPVILVLGFFLLSEKNTNSVANAVSGSPTGVMNTPALKDNVVNSDNAPSTNTGSAPVGNPSQSPIIVIGPNGQVLDAPPPMNSKVAVDPYQSPPIIGSGNTGVVPPAPYAMSKASLSRIPLPITSRKLPSSSGA